ncbi:MAG: deoxyribose-phosphate aldolase [Bacteroidetes bacterium]|nr:deoxyribose-phosphate aldolase [Bacteroidota bacterium]MCH8523251.1 deoxyribose-phosphate aldolase [Balneolales bacterium]
MKSDFRHIIPIDKVGIEERVARFNTRSIKKESKMFAMRLAMQMIDLTTLEGMDTDRKVEQLCNKAIRPFNGPHEIPKVAAICVYPPFVSTAKKALGDSGVHVASVATSFPSGHASMSEKIAEVKYCVNEGADEIDMVISRGEFLKGNYNFTFDEVCQIKEACGKAHLKVILETGELQTLENVRKASDIAMYAGADFIKTSTGKVSPAATQPVTLVMLEAIRDYYLKTGIKIGMKPAGGIRDTKTALRYLVMVKETLGSDWLNPDLFRFGASALANDLIMQIVKQETGVYQSGDYFSKD